MHTLVGIIKGLDLRTTLGFVILEWGFHPKLHRPIVINKHLLTNEQTYSELLKTQIDGLEIRDNKVVGSNGSLDRYPIYNSDGSLRETPYISEASMASNNIYVIIGKVTEGKDIDYLIFDNYGLRYSRICNDAKESDFTSLKMIENHQKLIQTYNKIANGKFIKESDGKYHISSINGTYRDLTEEKNKEKIELIDKTLYNSIESFKKLYTKVTYTMKDLDKNNDYIVVGILDNYKYFILINLNLSFRFYREDYVDDMTDNFYVKKSDGSEFSVEYAEMINILKSGYKIHGLSLMGTKEGKTGIAKTEVLYSLCIDNNPQSALKYAVLLKKDKNFMLTYNIFMEFTLTNLNNSKQVNHLKERYVRIHDFNANKTFNIEELQVLYKEEHEKIEKEHKVCNLGQEKSYQNNKSNITKQSGLLSKLFNLHRQ